MTSTLGKQEVKYMNKDEILAKSRNAYKGEDEMTKQVKLKAASISRAVGLLLCVIGAVVDGIFLENGLIGLSCWTVYWGMHTVEGWVMVADLKTKYGWIGAAFNSLLFVLFAVALVIRVLNFV